jgi:3-hydroxyacyl-CoA dehydrogenase
MGSEIKKVGVIGAGLMGSGIAQVAAMRGFEVTLSDVNEVILQKGLERIREILGRLVEAYEKSSGSRGISADQQSKTLAAITCSLNSRDFLAADIVIEAAVENEVVKKMSSPRSPSQATESFSFPTRPRFRSRVWLRPTRFRKSLWACTS